MIPDYYNTIEQSSVAEFKERGSRFVAFAMPISNVNDFKINLAAIKNEHPKATHHCFAYRIGADGSTHRVSDDGEPSGSAGRPILGQLDRKQVTNGLVIVARYFGGTLLGIPGLINAYKTAASMVLQVTPVVQMPVLARYDLQFDYTKMNEVMAISKKFNCLILEKELNLFCSMQLGIPRFRLDEVLYQLNDLCAIELKKIEEV
ncbi:MAG: IMPACT family protein [Chitinophagaceae bacterium]